MRIIINNGYQYFDLGNDMYALVMDEDGNPLRADEKEWVETEDSYVLFPKFKKKGKLH